MSEGEYIRNKRPYIPSSKPSYNQDRRGSRPFNGDRKNDKYSFNSEGKQPFRNSNPVYKRSRENNRTEYPKPELKKEYRRPYNDVKHHSNAEREEGEYTKPATERSETEPYARGADRGERYNSKPQERDEINKYGSKRSFPSRNDFKPNRYNEDRGHSNRSPADRETHNKNRNENSSEIHSYNADMGEEGKQANCPVLISLPKNYHRFLEQNLEKINHAVYS